MKVGLMQPYFFPYLGYFQLVSCADLFVLYDNIKYTKKGWINRNRILLGGQPSTISVPLKGGSDGLDIVDREVAHDFNRSKLLNKIKEAYRRAPYFESVFPVVERVIGHEEPNLFRFLKHSISETCGYLSIDTEIAVSSDFPIDASLTGQDRVIALCRNVAADMYVNAIGGVALYSDAAFRSAGLELRFIRSGAFQYRQYGDTFVPSLSIIDVMMFNSNDAIRRCLTIDWDLVPGIQANGVPTT